MEQQKDDLQVPISVTWDGLRPGERPVLVLRYEPIGKNCPTFESMMYGLLSAAIGGDS